MKAIAAFACVASAALAGCAATGTNTAMYDDGCKLGPIAYTTSTGIGKARPVNRLDQAYAQMQLGSSDFRFRQLVARGPVNNLTENVMQECQLPDLNEAS
jgi:hypothetical protein